MGTKSFLVGLVICMAVLITTPFSAGASESIKILVPTSMTGPLTGIEQFAMEGAEMALAEINTAGGINGRMLVLITEDTQSTVPGAVNALQKLVVANPDATAIYGVLMSHFALAFDPIIRKAGIPFLTGASNLKVTAQGNPWIFRIRPNDGTQTKLLVKYLVEDMGAKKIGIFYDTNEYGKGGMENITSALKERGLEPVIVEAHNSGDKDFTPQFLKFRKAKPDLVVPWNNNPVDAALTVRTWHQLGRPFKLVGCPAYPPSQPVWSMVKNAAEGVQCLIDAVITDESPKSVQKVAAVYKTKFKKDMNFASFSGYDAIKILAQAITKAGTEPEKLREALHEGTYKGLVTTYQFDEKGDGAWEVSIAGVKNGKLIQIKRVKLN